MTLPKVYGQLSQRLKYRVWQKGVSLLDIKTNEHLIIPWEDLELLIRQREVWIELYVTGMNKDSQSKRVWENYKRSGGSQ